MLVKKKKSLRAAAAGEGPEEVDVKKNHCVYAEQPDSGKHVEHNLFSFSELS